MPIIQLIRLKCDYCGRETEPLDGQETAYPPDWRVQPGRGQERVFCSADCQEQWEDEQSILAQIREYNRNTRQAAPTRIIAHLTGVPERTLRMKLSEKLEPENVVRREGERGGWWVVA